MACNKAPAEDDDFSPTPTTDVVLPLGIRMLAPRRRPTIPSALSFAAAEDCSGGSNPSLGCGNADELDDPSLGWDTTEDLDDSGAALAALSGILITSRVELILGWREDGADEGGVDRTDLVSTRLTGCSFIVPPPAFAEQDGAPQDRIVSADSQRSTSALPVCCTESCLSTHVAFATCTAERWKMVSFRDAACTAGMGSSGQWKLWALAASSPAARG